MTRRVKLARILGAIVATAAFLNTFCGQSSAALIYQQNFDNSDGVPAVTPGGGVLGLGAGGANGNAVFDATGGIVGGVLNASSPSPASTASAISATTLTGGSAISGPGSLSKFTLSFWVKVDSFSTSSVSRDHRTLIIGDSASPGEITLGTGGANSVVFTVRNNVSGKLNPKTIDVVLNGSATAGLDGSGNPKGIVGTTTTAGTWQFIALTYDGTSSNANDSADQLAATAGASQVNGQLYFGSSALSVSRFDAPFNNDFSANTSHGDATKPSAGAVNFGSAAKLLLANNAAASRGLDGFIDDVRVYDSIFSAADVEQVRLQGLLGIVPEPASFILTAIGGIAALGLRRRRTKAA